MNQNYLVPSAPPLSEININFGVNPEWESTMRHRYKKESEKEVSDEIKNIWEIHENGMAKLNKELDDYKAKHDKKKEELELKYTMLLSKINFLIPPNRNSNIDNIENKMNQYRSLKGEERDSMVFNTIISYEKKLAKIEEYLRKITDDNI